MEAVETDRDRIVIIVVVVVDPGVFCLVLNHLAEVDMKEIQETVPEDVIAVHRWMKDDAIVPDRPNVRREIQNMRGVKRSR